MVKEYLTEAFQELKLLEEEAFDINNNGIADAAEFINNDEAVVDEVEEIIDPLAETEEDLQDSYIGKVILDCSVCQSKIYKDAEEVIIDEAGELVNIGEECPYCHSIDGYKVIGQVAEFCPECEESEEEVKVDTDAENVDVEVEPKSEEEPVVEEPKEEEHIEEALKEDMQNVQIETDKEKITVTSEPKEEAIEEVPAIEEPVSEEPKEEVIAPVEPETEEKFKSETEVEEEPEYSDIDIGEIDEEGFDKLGESYLKRVYENVKSFKTTNGSIKGNNIKLEGIITFKSGKEAKTNFVFEAKTVTNNGKVKFTGLNEQFAKGRKTYTLTGKVNNGKLFTESLVYNYHGKDAKTGESKRLYGRVVNR